MPEEFEATAHAFENRDWADITLHSCTANAWGHAPGDPRYVQDEYRLNPPPVLEVPTLLLHGAADGVNHLDTSLGQEVLFRGPYECRLLAGVGHFPQREAPAEVPGALLHFFKSSTFAPGQHNVACWRHHCTEAWRFDHLDHLELGARIEGSSGFLIFNVLRHQV